MKIKEIFGSVVGYSSSIVLIAIWIVGAVHGTRKHENNPLSENGWYYSFYYGVEWIWHEHDYSALNEDITTAIYLLNKPTDFDPEAAHQYSETKKKYRKNLKRLDNEELEYIKSGVECFLAYMSAHQDDLIRAFNRYNTSGEFEIIQSSKSKNEFEKCSKYNLGEMLTELNEASDTMLEVIVSRSKTESDIPGYLCNGKFVITQLKKDFNQARKQHDKTFDEIFEI